MRCKSNTWCTCILVKYHWGEFLMLSGTPKLISPSQKAIKVPQLLYLHQQIIPPWGKKWISMKEHSRKSLQPWESHIVTVYSQPTEDLGAAADTLAAAAHGGSCGCLAWHRAGSSPFGLCMESYGISWVDFLLNSNLFSKWLHWIKWDYSWYKLLIKARISTVCP